MSPLTDHQKQYLVQNSHKHNLKTLSKHTGVSEFRIEEYCKLNGLTYRNYSKQSTQKSAPVPVSVKDPHFVPDPPKKKVNRDFGRQYSNSSPFGIADELK